MSECRQMSWPKNLKKTKQRLVLIEALGNSKKPLTVQEISEELMHRGNPMWLSTIYRVLDTLLEYGMIQKSAEHESGTALYEIGDKHRHYAVCVDCKRAIEIEGCPIESFLPDLQSKSFHVMGHKLQISGYCNECFSRQNCTK